MPVPSFKSGELLGQPYFAFMLQTVEMLRHHERHILQLEPEFFDQFACTGCGLCCQRPWNINLSQTYYEKWQDEISSHPSGLYRQPFVLRKEPSPDNYADIRRKPGTAECLFLMDDRRCFIQATYGEEALSECCKSFPRYDGWFGSFLGRFMITSCPEVHELAWNFPAIRYTIGKVVPDKWQEMQSTLHPLGLYQGYLWLGLQLDLFALPNLTPVQALRRLSQVLGQLRLLPVAPGDAELARLYAFAIRPEPEPSPAVPDMNAVFALLRDLLGSQPAVQAYVNEVALGWNHPPCLQADESGLLTDFLRSYLGYRCLSASYFSGQAIDFFYPFYYALSLQMTLLQWLALYYRWREGGQLTREHLLRAATTIGYRYEQGTLLIEPLRQLSPVQCLQGMQQMLVFDWTA